MSETVSLQDVCEAIVDCEHKTAPEDPNGMYFAVGTPSMKGNQIDYSQARRISEETFAKWTRRLSPEIGDLLLAREAPVGPVVRIPQNLNVAPGQRTVLIRPNSTEVNAEYLYYLLSSPIQQAALLRYAEGSTVPHLNVSDVRSFALPRLPGLVEQRAIAEVLGALDDKIAANEKVVARTAELCAAIYKSFSDRSETRVDLREIVDTQYGVTVSADDSSNTKLLRVTDINKRPWISWSEVPTCQVSGSELTKYQLSPGDIVVARMADPGKAAYIDQDAPESVFASYLVRLEPRLPQFGLYLYHFLISPEYQSYVNQNASGSVQRHLNAKKIVDFSMPVVGETELEQFNERVSAARQQMSSINVQSDALARTRDELLPLLMSGKITVKDAEAVVSDAV